MYVELEISSHDILINQIPTGNNPTIIEFFLNNYIKLNWKGNWAAGQYNVNDVVRYNQATWVANKNTTQTPSQISTDWGLMVVDGLDGVGVTNIDLIETIDLVDYYRMYFSDGSHFDYSLKNGEKGDTGTGIDDISSDNSITGKHIIRITLTNGSWYEFTVLDGNDGEMNVIEEVQVNGTTIPVTNKSVNIPVPTQPIDIGAEPANSNIQEHILSTSNPHSTTKSQVGLGNVDNTSDADKPLSNAEINALSGKVDKETGKGLSQENFTTEEKTKLAGLAPDKWLGEYPSLLALQTAHPTGIAGNSAYVDLGAGVPVATYVWDTSDQAWVKQQGDTTAETPESVKQKYESNPDTNAFTDAEKTKLSGISSGADVTKDVLNSATTNNTIDDNNFFNFIKLVEGVPTLVKSTFYYLKSTFKTYFDTIYSSINHNHNLNDLTEKSYNSLTDKPDLSSLHTHANKEDLDNYDPDNFEPANSNIQEHIAETNIHIDSSSELGEDINETNHSLLIWNGLKALKVTFARLKTWIGSLYLKLDQTTPQTIQGNVNVNGNVNAVTTNVNQSTLPSVNASQDAAILQDGSAFTGTDYVMPTNNVAVKFVASAAHTMGDFTVRVKSSATLTSTTATLAGYLYSDSAGSPSTLLATGNAILHGSITTSYQELSLGTQYNLVAGTTYWLVIRWSSAPTGGNIIFDSNSDTNGGATSSNAVSWTLTNVRLRYRLRGRTFHGVNSFSTNSYGVYGQSTNNLGVYGQSTNSFGVYGQSTNNLGVYGQSTNSFGVYGISTNSYGVRGFSTNNNGVYGTSTNSYGVRGESTNNIGVIGTSTNNVGVYGISTNNRAGYFLRNTATPSAVPVVEIIQDHASDTNSVLDIRQDGTGEIVRFFDSGVEVASVEKGGLGVYKKGVVIGDNTDVASYENKGATRYRENAGGSFYEMVMKQTDGSYAWQSIVFNQ